MRLRNIILVLLIAGGVYWFYTHNPKVQQKVEGVVQSAAQDVAGSGPAENRTLSGNIRVWAPRGDDYYHATKDCPYIKGGPVPMALEKARGAYKPCPHCKPPVEE